MSRRERERLPSQSKPFGVLRAASSHSAIHRALICRIRRLLLLHRPPWSHMAASSSSIAVANSILRQIKASRSASDEHLATLHFLFGKNLERATIIVDQGGVKRVCGKPSGRLIFLVKGESKKKEEYVCFPETFCTCQSFFFDVVNKGEQLYCKHQIAAQLADAVDACTEVIITDEEMAVMLCRI